LGAFALSGALLYWAQDVLIPIVLAVLVTFLLSPLVIRLQRWGVPRFLAVPLVVLFAFAAVGGVGWAVAAQVARLGQELPEKHGPEIVKRVDHLLSYLPGPARRDFPSARTLAGVIARVRHSVEARTAPEKEKAIPVRVESDEVIPASLADYVGPVVGPLATAGLVVVLVVFMLFKREDL
jgi:predicted PurR-regulated permease PerM